MKKIILAICLFLLFAVNVGALTVDKITPDRDFLIYSANPEEVAKALNTDTVSLKEKVETQNILFLAVNPENTKQIQLICSETEFSNAVGNISNLTDSSIKALIPDITGINNVKGKIVLKDNQKYININMKSKESNFILTQYITIEDSKLYTLSFFTDENVSTRYIETAFEVTGNNPDEITIKPVPKAFKIIVIFGTVVFGLAFIVVLFTVIKDLFKKR